MDEAGLTWGQLDAIAAIYGPGLAGSLLVGMNAAKAIAFARGMPLVGVNHLEAHIYGNWLIPSAGDPPPEPTFPLLCFVVSGGHTDLILMRGHHDYERLGRTVDDAAGEAFDKVARLLGLPYPGGPSVQHAAESGNPHAYAFSRALLPDRCDFSFSGLKTGVLRLVQELQRERGIDAPERGQKLIAASLSAQEANLPVNDIAASFQAAVVDALVEGTARAVKQYHANLVLIAGGVAANKALREAMTARLRVPVRFPPIRYCTDNAAMVASAGYYRFMDGVRSGLDLDIVPNLALV